MAFNALFFFSIKGVPNVSYYRKRFQSKLSEMFTDLHACYSNIESRYAANLDSRNL
jgi:hypothetical protein